MVTVIALCLMLGAAGKSAQLPLYIWLPDAMEGPTPVSALIHAATMVTAGVYMVARTHVFLTTRPSRSSVVAIVGAATAIFAATIALVQNDIKRVLAYSTISQLGYMFLGLRRGGLFRGDLPSDDPRLLQGAALPRGGLGDSRAWAASRICARWAACGRSCRSPSAVMTVGVLAIAGIFPFAGFFSKDAILYAAFLQGTNGKILWFCRTFDGAADRVLYVPALVHGLYGRVAQPGDSSA